MRQSDLIRMAIRLIEKYSSLEWYERIRYRPEPSSLMYL